MIADRGGGPLDLILEPDRERPRDLAGLSTSRDGHAMTLAHVHQRGLIYKDVKAGNAPVDDAGYVWLTAFGIASRLPQERQAPAPPVVGGTR
jgi:hypothetical protein